MKLLKNDPIVAVAYGVLALIFLAGLSMGMALAHVWR
jgi:hypothetical protein